MKILLLQDVKAVGKKGEIKEVADGFALNAILPKKLALVATPDVLRKYELEQKQKHAEEKIQTELTQKTFADLKEKKVVMKANASDKGHLFASIHIGEILTAVKDQLHITLQQSCVELKQPIKEVGEYKLKLKAHGIDGVLTVEIAA